MTTYTDAVYTALLKSDAPMSSRAIYDAYDTFEDAQKVNKAIAYLVKTGRAECVGAEKPKNGKTIRVYRALVPADIDKALAEELQKSVMPEPEARALNHHPGSLIDHPDPKWEPIEKALAQRIEERDQDTAEAVIDPIMGAWPDASDDPVMREIARYREPCRIQDGHRLATHLYAGASVLEDRLPGLATSMREAADVLRERAA